MTAFPRSLFGRLALLMIAVTAVGFVAALLIFRYDRASLAERQFGDTKVVQIETLRAALASLQSQDRPGFLQRLGREYGVQLVPVGERPTIGRPAGGPRTLDLQDRLRARLGPDTEVRLQSTVDGGPIVWIKLMAGDSAWWAGFAMPRRDAELPTRVTIWSGVTMILLLIAAYLFAVRMNQPLKKLQDAVTAVGKGRTPPPLPESGPSEIAALAKGFNRMTANLKQMEDDRALLLAGVSHDLRTPLARLRLVAEMGVQESMKQGMVDDIEEMDRIIKQFLDFARGEDKEPLVMRNLNAIVEECIERYRRKGSQIALQPDADLPALPVREQSLERAIVNLIDNAFRYGSPTLDVSTRYDNGHAVIELADRGPGIPPSEVERLKQPFTRLDTARGSAAGGKLGSGLGLAIVDRVVARHGGTFDLLLRESGGTVARIALPLPMATAR